MADPLTWGEIAMLVSATAAVASVAVAGSVDKPKTILPVVDKATDANAAAAASRQRRKAKAAAGQQSTILTGAGGLNSAPATAGGAKTILGG